MTLQGLPQTAPAAAALPAGGSVGQVIAKRSASDYDAGWAPAIPRVGSLPATPYDGQEVYLWVPTSGSFWHLIWDQGTAKWWFLGGPALHAEDNTAVGLGGTSTPAINGVPKGQFDVRFGTGAYVYTSGSTYLVGNVIATGWTDTLAFQMFSNSASPTMGAAEHRVTTTAAGPINTQYGAAVGAVVASIWRWLSIVPVYLN